LTNAHFLSFNMTLISYYSKNDIIRCQITIFLLCLSGKWGEKTWDLSKSFSDESRRSSAVDSSDLQWQTRTLLRVSMVRSEFVRRNATKWFTEKSARQQRSDHYYDIRIVRPLGSNRLQQSSLVFAPAEYIFLTITRTTFTHICVVTTNYNSIVSIITRRSPPSRVVTTQWLAFVDRLENPREAFLTPYFLTANSAKKWSHTATFARAICHCHGLYITAGAFPGPERSYGGRWTLRYKLRLARAPEYCVVFEIELFTTQYIKSRAPASSRLLSSSSYYYR